MQNLKYPIGDFKSPEHISPDQLSDWITDIKQFPQKLKSLVQGLRKDQLGWHYRPGGWTIHQVIHHCADSHMNSFIRFKLALTEDSPTIKPYLEHLWAEMPDTLSANIDTSISILEGLHHRWGILLDNLGTDDLESVFIHPEHGKRFTLGETIALYSWHGNHHLAHVEQAIRFKGNFGEFGDENTGVV
ncbi:MAG: putative metal-dependent hydrolase [Bacteroidetes bacterium]|nr:MAG: putative metal-dependent hydrolase [Bacteroidota bacterium]